MNNDMGTVAGIVTFKKGSVQDEVKTALTDVRATAVIAAAIEAHLRSGLVNAAGVSATSMTRAIGSASEQMRFLLNSVEHLRDSLQRAVAQQREVEIIERTAQLVRGEKS